jgi:hypothetical protein
MKDKLIVFDNGGESFDRYTILDKASGDMVGASDSPYHPMGFGQHAGNVADNYWNIAYGAGWHRVNKRLLNKRIKFAVNHFLNDCAHIGKIIEFDQLPAGVQRFAKESLLA